MECNANRLLLLALAITTTIAVLLFLNKPDIETIKVIETVDTTYVPRIDTIYIEAEGGGDFEDPGPPDEIIVESNGDSLATYKESYSDSLVDIEVRIRVKGVLRDWGVRYELHIPVVRKDTTVYIERHRETIRTIKQWSINLGASMLFRYDPIDSYFAVGPQIAIVTKGNKVYGYSYLTDGSHLISITVPLTQ